MNRILPLLFILPWLGAFLWSLYSLLRHRSWEPWLFWDHFFLGTLLFSLLRFYLASLLLLKEKGYFHFLPHSSSYLSSLREYMMEGFALWNSRILRFFVFIWEQRPPQEVLLFFLLAPRIFVLFNLGLSLWELSLLPFVQSLAFLLIPQIIQTYLSLLSYLLPAKIDSLMLLWDLYPDEKDPLGLSFSWTERARDLGFTEEDRVMTMNYFLMLSFPLSSLGKFQKKKNQILLPFNFILSFSYLILCFLFFYKLFLT